MEWVHFDRDLNQEALTFTSLAPVNYQLPVDGKAVSTASDLSAGFNLATVAATPQYQQAIAQERVLNPKKIDPTDERAVPKAVKQLLDDSPNAVLRRERRMQYGQQQSHETSGSDRGGD